MTNHVPVALALLLVGCGSVQTTPSSKTLQRSGEVTQVAVGSPMVNDTSTTVTVNSVTGKVRVDGFRTKFVYLGLLASDPGRGSTIRVRYAEHRIVDGVENERPGFQAEVTLDLSQSRTIEFKGWRIAVLDANDSIIRYEVVGSPAP